MAVDMNELVVNTRNLLALTVSFRYEKYCGSPCLENLTEGQTIADFIVQLFLYFTPIQTTLEEEYILQRTQLESGNSTDLPVTPTDKSITEVAQFLQIDEVIIRLYIETFVKKHQDFDKGIEPCITDGTFQELSCYIQWDLQILDSPKVFTTDRLGNVSLQTSKFTDPESENEATETATATAATTPTVPISPLYVIITTLKDKLFDIPVRFQEDTRMWRYNHMAINELNRRRCGQGMSAELERAITENIEMVRLRTNDIDPLSETKEDDFIIEASPDGATTITDNGSEVEEKI